MKRTIVTLACIAITGIALAQAATANENNFRARPILTTTTATAVRTGTVNAFTPGQSIRVQVSLGTQPITYVLSPNVEYVDTTGRPISDTSIAAGSQVRLDFGGGPNGNTVDRVILLAPR